MPPGTVIEAESSKKNSSTSEARNPQAADRFDEFWAAYPRRVAKSTARQAWIKAVESADPDALIAGARAYSDHVASVGTEAKYIAHPATWLNKERWTDEYIGNSRPAQPNGAPSLAWRNYDDPNAYDDYDLTPIPAATSVAADSTGSLW